MSGLSATAKFAPRDDLGRFVEVNITPGVKAGAEEWIKSVFNRSQELVPVGKTGDLKASGEIIPTSKPGKTIVCGMQYTAPYAAYVEYGTGIRGSESEGAGDVKYSETWPGMPAQPYIRPAYDEFKDQAPDMIKSKIQLK